MRLLCLVALLSSTVIAQGEKPALSDLLQAKARIVQLESQLAQLSARYKVCDAQLTVAPSSQQQQEQATKAAMAAVEKDAGCAIDWQAQPVSCKGKP